MEPGIDFTELNSPAYVAWRAGTTTLFLTRFLAPMDCLKIPALGVRDRETNDKKTIDS